MLAKIYPNITDGCMFKIDKLGSKLCNDCGHITNNDGVCIDWSLHLVDSSSAQTISEMLHQFVDLRKEYLEKYRYVYGCQELNTKAKAVCVTQLSDARIIQLKMFKYTDRIGKKCIPNMIIDEEISPGLFIMSENSLIIDIIH